tara:strand:+ start:6656 stop:7336 length:681 start_codon:yes stop_codon:yes gene_type:complete
MDIDTLIIFGAGSFIAREIIKKIKFNKLVCISKTLKQTKVKKNKIKIYNNFEENKEDIKHFIKKTKITTLFLNNYTVDNLILRKTKKELNVEIEKNILNVFENSKILCEIMIENNFGRLIYFSSSRGLSSDVGISGYSISKNGLRGLMKSFSKEFVRYNITSNCLSLGFFKSPLFSKIRPDLKNKMLSRCDIKATGDIESIINAIYFISNSKYLTGSTLYLDGGYN